MWVIQYEENFELKNIKKIFRTKRDAQLFIKNNMPIMTSISIINIYHNLIDPSIKVGSNCFVYDELGIKTFYGEIIDSTNHYLIIQKENGETVDITIQTFNEKFVKGTLAVQQKN